MSYSGILFPERAVFLFFGVPCAPLWFLTILLSHRALVGLVDAACVTRARRARRRGSLTPTRAAEEAIGGDGAASGSANEVGAAVCAVYAWPLRRMEPLAVVATPLLLLVVCVSLGDPQPGPAIHASAAFFFFLLGVYNAFLSLRGARIAFPTVSQTTTSKQARRTSRRASSDSLPARAWTPSAFFLNAQRFKANVLLALFGAMVPVAAFWATMTYAWGGEELCAGADAVRVDRGDDSRERRVRGGNPGVGGEMRRVARRARRERGGDRRSRRT